MYNIHALLKSNQQPSLMLSRKLQNRVLIWLKKRHLKTLKNVAFVGLFFVLLCLSGCKPDWYGQNAPEIVFNTKLTVPAVPALDAKKPSPLIIKFSLDQSSLKAITAMKQS